MNLLLRLGIAKLLLRAPNDRCVGLAIAPRFLGEATSAGVSHLAVIAAR
jgi:hypothetical protein